MKKVTKKSLADIATHLKFELDPTELAILKKECEHLFQAFIKMRQLPQIEEVEPLFFPYEIVGDLREDYPVQLLTQAQSLKNAKQKKDGQIVIPKVVK